MLRALFLPPYAPLSLVGCVTSSEAAAEEWAYCERTSAGVETTHGHQQVRGRARAG